MSLDPCVFATFLVLKVPPPSPWLARPRILDIVEDVDVKTLAAKRLRLLEHKFILHNALNALEEGDDGTGRAAASRPGGRWLRAMRAPVFRFFFCFITDFVHFISTQFLVFVCPPPRCGIQHTV